MMAIVEIQDIWKSFRNRRKLVEAVRGVNLAIQEGEVFGFLGPNGVGKTTTLRMLTTPLPPDKGRAIIAGFDLRSEPYRVRECIGYVSQSGGADSALTGRENAIVNAARLLFRGIIVNGTVLAGFIIIGILAILAMTWAVSSFKRAAS